MRGEDAWGTPYIPLTGIAKKKKSTSPSYLIQSWMQRDPTIEYLQMWEKTYNLNFQEEVWHALIHTARTTSTTLMPSL